MNLLNCILSTYTDHELDVQKSSPVRNSEQERIFITCILVGILISLTCVSPQPFLKCNMHNAFALTCSFFSILKVKCNCSLTPSSSHDICRSRFSITTIIIMSLMTVDLYVFIFFSSICPCTNVIKQDKNTFTQ